MKLEKILNKRLIKMVIWSKYIYEIDADEKIENALKEKKEDTNAITKFIKDWLDEMKKDLLKK